MTDRRSGVYEIVVLLEDRAGHTLDPDFLETITTVGDVFRLLLQFTRP